MSNRRIIVWSVVWGIVVSLFAVLNAVVFTDSMPTCKITAQQEERYDALYKDCLVQRPTYHPQTCKSVAKDMICGE